MKNNISIATTLTHLGFAACLLAVVAGQAAAQSFDPPREEQESKSRQASTSQQEPTQTPESSNTVAAESTERGLPSIVGMKREADSAQVPEYQQQRRTLDSTPDAFGAYVKTVTGATLELFGKDLFSDVPTTFAPFNAMQVNDDYVVGPGDELQIRGWGMVNVEVTTKVDRSGAVYIPRVGSVKVAGVRYRDLQGHLKQAISKNYSNFELTASISQSRAVQVYVVGHAARPGTYTLNAMSTVLNALFTSGGPNSSGSMRNIQLKRGGQVVTTFDLYDMLVRGDKSGDASLRDGDVIYIAQVGPLVALTGNVKTPAIFELKGPSSMAELLTWAGGVDSAAEQKPVVIEKTVDNAYQSVAELIADKAAIDSQLSSVMVAPADVIRVFAPSAVPVQAQLLKEYVRVSGDVHKSGVFELQPGETLRQLMFRLGGIRESGYVLATQLTRESVRRSQQAKLDEMAKRFERDIESAAAARLSGTTDTSAVAIQASEQERQRRMAQNLRAIKATGRIVLELEDGNAQLKDLPDLPLQDGDSIFVPRKPGTVEVLGSVAQSNSFIYKPRRTVKDYVLLSGGETESADTSKIYVIRADGTATSGRSMGLLSWVGGINDFTVNPGDTIIVPEALERSNWRQSLKEWTAIFYQFGLGAAGLKVLQD